MTPAQLVSVYPHLDVMMAETILQAYENGTLASYDFSPPESPPKTRVLKTIQVENYFASGESKCEGLTESSSS